MNILFCYYQNIQHDARALEELSCLKLLGRVAYTSFAPPTKTDAKDVTLYIAPRRNYALFLRTCIRAIRSEKPDVVFLHDNYCAPLIPILRRIVPESRIIFDMSELYIGIPNTPFPTSIAAKAFMRSELRHLSKADIVISASEERADIAHGYYRLRERPIVFDNIHIIEESYDKEACDNKYSEIFAQDAFFIMCAGGISDGRRTHELMRAVAALGNGYQLIIAGYKAVNDPVYDDILRENTAQNIHYVGYIKRSELRYLYQRCHINVVAFAQTSINNIFCASGKQNEGFFEGLPMLCTQNPPLRTLCQTHGVGIADDHFTDGILTLQKNLEAYRENVRAYTLTINMAKRIQELADSIIKRLSAGGRQ